jgi:hypothetical protein
VTVIPDSIEPVEGWKAFLVVPPNSNGAHEALLISPSRGTIWQPGEAVVADGCVTHTPPEWVPVRGNGPPSSPQRDYGPEQHSVKVSTPRSARSHRAHEPLGASGGFAVQGYLSGFGEPPLPQTVLPPGYSWRLVRHQRVHEPPQDRCGCGVHITKSFLCATGYASEPRVFARVKGWGKVAVHDDGWRVEKAYPSEIYTDAIVDLSAYGVPVMPLSELPDTERLLAYGPYNYSNPASPIDSRFNWPLSTLIGMEAALGMAMATWAWVGNVYAVPGAIVALLAVAAMLALR